MICDDTDYSFGRTSVDCVWISDPASQGSDSRGALTDAHPAIAGPFACEYAGAREFAPFPGRAMVRPIALLLCLVFALQSRAGAAAAGQPALSPASPESHAAQLRPAHDSVEATPSKGTA